MFEWASWTFELFDWKLLFAFVASKSRLKKMFWEKGIENWKFCENKSSGVSGLKKVFIFVSKRIVLL